MIDQQGFILTRQWRDTNKGMELEFWLASENGPLQLRIHKQQATFFLPVVDANTAADILKPFPRWQRKSIAMQDFSKAALDAYHFDSQRTLRDARDALFQHGLSPLEADINPHDRFLMERFVRGSMRFRGEAKQALGFTSVDNPQITSADYQPKLKMLSLDIETAMHGLSLYSIGLYATDQHSTLRKVFMIAKEQVADGVDIFSSEEELMFAFFDWLTHYDPDIIIGWNVINFDMWFLERICQKHKMAFRLGRNQQKAYWRKLDDEGERRAIFAPGRVVLDGIELLKAATYQFESFSLNNVARELLHDGKLITGSDRGNQITELFYADKKALAEYNIQDCKLVWDIFEKTRLLDFAIARSRLTGLPLDRIGGSVASFDFRYLPLLHRKGFVAPNGHLREDIEASPGGFVMDSQPGIYDHVLVLDFKSLYPSIIRSFKIDPMGMAIGLNEEMDQKDLVPGFKGAWFAKHQHILPDVIAEIWASRDQAKADHDAALSQAIKILMNSFYGVLGSAGCRFYDSRLASSITRRGHQIIQQTAKIIEKGNLVNTQCSVIYGDTDSVFVWLKDVTDDERALAVGKKLEQQLNQRWQQTLKTDYDIDCALEIELETHFQRFLMPTIRGSKKGSKKRYAGVIQKGAEQQLVFKGLENVRTDWTRLARDFQLELYRRVFFDEPYRDYVSSKVQQVLNGELDDDLVYRKRLRRKLDEYQRNIAPQVQAARKAVAQTDLKIRRGDWIEYVITVNGAEPVVAQPSMIDYQHYIDKQLAPVADGILHFLGHRFSEIIDQQMGLFD